MTKVTEALSSKDGPVFICDFTPPRGGDPALLEGARELDADFVAVAYNPGKLVRVDSVAAAYQIKQRFGRDVIFNLSPRDMNKIALESRLLGAQVMGLENVLVVQGDAISERDAVGAVSDYTATGLISAIREMNEGLDYRGAKLRSACDLCIGASIDVTRGLVREAKLTHRKVEAGAQFFVTQPVFSIEQITAFLESYDDFAGEQLNVPIFWGLQILAREGVLFSGIPDNVLHDLDEGRDGVDIALKAYEVMRGAGIRSFYLVSPILKGGARDYAAGGRLLSQAKQA